MANHEQETTRSAIAVEQEYHDYLARFVATDELSRPLTLPEFQTVLDQWQREYHAAWLMCDTATMRMLERLLSL